MKFNEAMKFNTKKTEPTSSANTNQPTTIRDPDKYPKEIWPWDTGIADRGVTGFTSDVNVLTGKETVGTSTDDTYITFKDGKENSLRSEVRKIKRRTKK